MRTLKEFQENMPNGLYSIAVDITGFCNAKCKYCPAGNDLTNKGKFVELETFEAILNKLIEYKLYTKESDFNIYCLGEPLLHPQINDILNILNKYGIRITISTNASYIPKFDKESLKCVKRFLISMPGFSQESYDRIHGFNFNKIKENVISLREKVRELSDNTIPFDMSYHIYQFNEAEMVPAKQFCEENDIRFAPNYAVMFDKDKCMDYVTGNMSYEELKDISKEIFLGVLDQQIKDAPRNYCDFQHRFLSITVDGDIRICSSFRREVEPTILIGNIINDNIDDIIFRKYNHPRCDKCIKAGLTLAKGYECKVWPNGYYEVMKENEFIKEYIKDDKLEEKLKFMHLVRDYERSEYNKNLQEKVEKFLGETMIEKNDIKHIVLKYTRFGLKTYNRLNQ